MHIVYFSYKHVTRVFLPQYKFVMSKIHSLFHPLHMYILQGSGEMSERSCGHPGCPGAEATRETQLAA